MLGWLWLQLMAAAMPTGRRVSVSHSSRQVRAKNSRIPFAICFRSRVNSCATEHLSGSIGMTLPRSASRFERVHGQRNHRQRLTVKCHELNLTTASPMDQYLQLTRVSRLPSTALPGDFSRRCLWGAVTGLAFKPFLKSETFALESDQGCTAPHL